MCRVWGEELDDERGRVGGPTDRGGVVEGAGPYSGDRGRARGLTDRWVVFDVAGPCGV